MGRETKTSLEGAELKLDGFVVGVMAFLVTTVSYAQAHFRSNQYHFTWLQAQGWQPLSIMVPPVVANFAKAGTNNEVTCNAAANSSRQAASQTTAAFVAGYSERELRAMLLKSGLEGVTVFPKKSLKIAGRDAVAFVSEYHVQHVGTTDFVRQINVFSTRRDLIYTITCVMPQKAYKLHEGEVWKVISGFYIDP